MEKSKKNPNIIFNKIKIKIEIYFTFFEIF